MAYKIGFMTEIFGAKQEEAACAEKKVQNTQNTPRRSVVQVRFPGRGMDLAYYNDQFDLKCGDMVYVDGKLEGQLGHVQEVNYNFKIKIADYHRVIAVVDTTVHGQFYMAGSHFVTFDREALPDSKAVTWFMAPRKEDEFVSGSDDTSFSLDNLSGMEIRAVIAERGHEYYLQNRVRYISIDGTKGYAIVEGREAYEVEFEYHNGEISRLTCSCFCSYHCKHEFAAMLQLREILDWVREHYEEELEETGYFAAVSKETLFTFAIGNRQDGSFRL